MEQIDSAIAENDGKNSFMNEAIDLCDRTDKNALLHIVDAIAA